MAMNRSRGPWLIAAYRVYLERPFAYSALTALCLVPVIGLNSLVNLVFFRQVLYGAAVGHTQADLTMLHNILVTTTAVVGVGWLEVLSLVAVSRQLDGRNVGVRDVLNEARPSLAPVLVVTLFMALAINAGFALLEPLGVLLACLFSFAPMVAQPGVSPLVAVGRGVVALRRVALQVLLFVSGLFVTVVFAMLFTTAFSLIAAARADFWEYWMLKGLVSLLVTLVGPWAAIAYALLYRRACGCSG